MSAKTFGELAIGMTFKFAAEGQYLGMAQGPWIRTSDRRYKPLGMGASHRVGTKRVQVVELPWRVEVQTEDGGSWATNGVRYATQPEAQTAGEDLFGRWLAVKAWRLVEQIPDGTEWISAPRP